MIFLNEFKYNTSHLYINEFTRIKQDPELSNNPN